MTDEQIHDPPVTSGEVISQPEVTGEWLSPPAAADRLGMSERTLWRLVKAGRYQKRTVNRRAEILVPVTVTGATEENRENVSVAPVTPPDRPDSLAVRMFEEWQAREVQRDEIIRQKDARIIDLERENAMLRERVTPWHRKLKRWLTGE